MAAPRSSLLFDPDTHLEDALRIFMNSHRGLSFGITPSFQILQKCFWSWW